MNNVFVKLFKFAREIEPSRTEADIQKDAVAFAKMLRDHQRAGDRHNVREQLYLRVFEKTQAIKAARIGNMV
jgi:hypothetical protein